MNAHNVPKRGYVIIHYSTFPPSHDTGTYPVQLVREEGKKEVEKEKKGMKLSTLHQIDFNFHLIFISDHP